MKKYLLSLLILIGLTGVSPVSLASDTGYEIELIIFEDTKGRYLQAEDWSYNDMLQKNLASHQAKKKPIRDPQYRVLRWSEGRLAANARRLDNNPNYKILVRKRWRQTGLGPNETFDIAINSKLKEDNDDEDSSSPSYITGYVKLVMSRYLHFGVDLEYFRPQGESNEGTIYRKYPVVSERRMRSKETHYIDHPLVGIVVHATPYTIKSKARSTQPSNYKSL